MIRLARSGMDRANERSKTTHPDFFLKRAAPRALLGMLALAAGMIAAFLFTSGGKGVFREAVPGAEIPSKKLIRLRAPEFVGDLAFIDADGKTRRLSEWRGRMVVLNLWATWCAPCKAEMPSLDRLEAKLGGSDFAVVALSMDRGGMKEPAAFLAREGLSHLQLYNDATGEASRQMGAPGSR